MASEGAYPVNSYDIEANYGPASSTPRHIVSLAGSYDLPFGRDRQFGNDWNRAARRGRGRLVGELRAHRAHRLPDHGAGQLNDLVGCRRKSTNR